MNNEFLQFELDVASREVTTFTTHEGLHRFKRLNFGTNTASEILERKIDEILGNLPNCMAFADDVILSLHKKCPYSELFWSGFSRIRPENGGILRSVSLRIQSECRKMRTRIIPNTDTFCAVLILLILF